LRSCSSFFCSSIQVGILNQDTEHSISEEQFEIC
jgi:hypothetical protein